jgi:hypothetical protein
MAQVALDDIIARIVKCEVSIADGIPALLNRQTGTFMPEEGLQLDYKSRLDPANTAAIAEISRDILGFSNSQGGIILLGVNDADHRPSNQPSLDVRKLREAFGQYIGTRVTFDTERVPVPCQGRTELLYVIQIGRSSNTYPTLLRKDIEIRPQLIRKLKYLSGTLFYREGDSTMSIPPTGEIEAKARDLGFTGVAPRTRTSFLLQEDKPGLRLYAPINDKFYGRDDEISELITKFDDPRGRGISIAGFGGVGKTELAIRIASDLYRRGTFKKIYSGSAKQTLLTASGVQQSDPIFIDMHSFLSDLAAWLGLNAAAMTTVPDLKAMCLEELKKLAPGKVLLFVDNLETVSESNRELLNFLDNELPANCWILATARVHKIRNYVYPKELREMDPDSAGHLLRHELKRQGLDELAATPIADLKEKARALYFHPLAIRWFAWSCKKNPTLWQAGISRTAEADLESFCVAHTLGSLDSFSQKVLGAVWAVAGVADDTFECIAKTSGVSDSLVEPALWELECAGLIMTGTREDGKTIYAVAQLARTPVADLIRKERWEPEYVQNLRGYVKQQNDHEGESQLARDLLAIQPREIQDYTRDQQVELEQRIDRVLERVPIDSKVRLKWLRAECQRHQGNLLTADGLYREIAEAVLPQNKTLVNSTDRARLLLEAATTAKMSSQAPAQLNRAISYLTPIENLPVVKARALGMLTEMYALLGRRPAYEGYCRRVEQYIRQNPFQDKGPLEAALARARAVIERITS